MIIWTFCLSFGSFAQPPWQDTAVFYIGDSTEFEIWERQMLFKVDVLGYQFHKVVAYNVWQNETVVGVDFHYFSPTDQPIRIQAKVKFSDDMWIRTNVFLNAKAGEQKYTYYFDTKGYGEWGLKPHLPMFLWVETCQTGPNCMPSTPGLLDEQQDNDQPTPDFRVIRKDELEKQGIDSTQLKKIPTNGSN